MTEDEILEQKIHSVGLLIKDLSKTDLKLMVISLLDYTTRKGNWEYIINRCITDTKVAKNELKKQKNGK